MIKIFEHFNNHFKKHHKFKVGDIVKPKVVDSDAAVYFECTEAALKNTIFQIEEIDFEHQQYFIDSIVDSDRIYNWMKEIEIIKVEDYELDAKKYNI